MHRGSITSSVTISCARLLPFPPCTMVWKNLRYLTLRLFSIQWTKCCTSDSVTLLHRWALSRNISVRVSASTTCEEWGGGGGDHTCSILWVKRLFLLTHKSEPWSRILYVPSQTEFSACNFYFYFHLTLSDQSMFNKKVKRIYYMVWLKKVSVQRNNYLDVPIY